MIMSIIMGMGMPTVAVYIVLATVAAPVLVKLGIPMLTAHFFCFYFGILACITPEHFTDIIGVAVLAYLIISEGKNLKAEMGKVAAQ